MIITKRAETIGTTITWFVGFALNVFILVFFVLASNSLAEEGANIEFKQEFKSFDFQRELIKILNAPVNVSEEGINVKELIALWSSDNSKYEGPLKEEAGKVLVDFQYDYIDPQVGNLKERGFKLIILSEKHVKGEGLPNELFEIVSESYKKGNVVLDKSGDDNLAGVYIPVSEIEKVYVVLRASEIAKEESEEENE